MHDIIAVSPLEERHVPAFQGAVRFLKADLIPAVDQEGGHAATCNGEGDRLALVYQIDEHRQICVNVHDFGFGHGSRLVSYVVIIFYSLATIFVKKNRKGREKDLEDGAFSLVQIDKAEKLAYNFICDNSGTVGFYILQ